MATITRTYVVDDLDQSQGDVNTVYFSLGRAQYEIDLSPRNAAKLRKKLSKFIEHAKPVKAQRGTRRGTVSRPAASGADQTRAIRDWANQNGFEVSARGRISQAVRDAFEAAH